MTGSAATDLDEVQRIVLAGLAPHRAQVFLFGSRAEGRPARGSDIDVGILPLEPLPPGLLTDIAEALENSRVLYAVDLVDLSRVEPSFRERVAREGIRWR
ncbi:MAG TPA: nucleotidyltransferase domain-containing protein [Vicinamibacteria bacterium]|nr:nucleotidyltransferase domain-containing protein [Vicinamibacteria bacterium]